MIKKDKPSSAHRIMIIVILMSFGGLIGLFQYYAHETKKLQAKKSEALDLVDAWKNFESTTKDLAIAEDLPDARKKWKMAIDDFDRVLSLFAKSDVIKNLRRTDSAFDAKISETENTWRILKPRIEYVQPRLDDYIDSQDAEHQRSLLYELLFQVEQGLSKQAYMTLFDLTFYIKYMVSSLSPYYISILNSSVQLISTTIDRQTLRVQYIVIFLSLVLIGITIAFINATQKSLRESQERFRQIVERSPFPQFIVAADSRIEYINPKFREVFGYELRDIPTMTAWQEKTFPDPEDRTASSAFLNEYLEKNRSAESEPHTFSVRCKNDSRRVCVFRLVDMVDKKRFIICEDITERMHAEEALRKSERKFRAIFDQTFQFMGLLNTEGTLLEMNKTALDYIQATEAEMVGKPFWDTPWWSHEPAEREKLQAAIRTAAAGEFVRFETTNRSHDGSLVYLDVSIKPMKDDTGRVVLLIPEGRDITERKKAEQERAQLISAIEQASEIIVIMGLDGTIQYANPAVERILGYSPGDTIGIRSILRPPEPADRRKYEQLWKSLSSESPWSGRIENRKKDGALINLEVTISPVRDQAGSILSLVAIARDITKELRMEQQLRQSQKMESIGTLAGGIAHDFNNILAAIIGYAELTLMHLPKDSAVSKNLEQILKSGTRARDLVKQILAFSRKQNQERAKLDVCGLVMETAKLLRATIPATIDIKQNFPGHACMVNVDPVQMHQVLMNLCTNAAQAMEKSAGVLHIRLAMVELRSEDMASYPDLLPGEYVRLTVSDTGTGIEPQIIDRIFDPFFTTKEVGKGTGMGLAVVHGIVKDHGGEIRVYSEMGRGTTVTILLPRIAEQVREEHYQQPRLPGGDETILFVDDEEMIVDIVPRMLLKLGYKVISRKSSLDALETFQKDPYRFDVVITDQTMPGMTGQEFAQQVLSIRPDIPVILCTGFSERISEEQALEAGIRAFVLKPFNMEELAGTIRGVLNANKNS